MKKYVAEMIGTMVLTLLGCGTAVFLGCDSAAGVVGTAIAFGLSVVSCGVVNDGFMMSDHLPLVIEIKRQT